MPGRNPNEAVAAFLAPFEEATKVLHGFCRCSILGKRDYRIGTQHTLVVNPDKEKNLPRLGSFSAELRFELIEADPKKYGGTVRCTTRGYRYRLADLSGHELWLLHWHPSGNSRYEDPHLHVPPRPELHLPTGRITFEKVIAWCIEYGAELNPRYSKDEAIRLLAKCEDNHIRYRTWDDTTRHPREVPSGAG